MTPKPCKHRILKNFDLVDKVHFGKMSKFGAKYGECTILINFAKTFGHSFPLARTAQTNLLDIINVNLSVVGLLFSSNQHYPS